MFPVRQVCLENSTAVNKYGQRRYTLPNKIVCRREGSIVCVIIQVSIFTINVGEHYYIERASVRTVNRFCRGCYCTADVMSGQLGLVISDPGRELLSCLCWICPW